MSDDKGRVPSLEELEAELEEEERLENMNAIEKANLPPVVGAGRGVPKGTKKVEKKAEDYKGTGRPAGSKTKKKTTGLTRTDKQKAMELPVFSDNKFYCCRCGIAYGKQAGNFAATHSFAFRGTGYLPMCNKCVEDMFNFYKKTLGNGKAAMRRMCMKLDLYWNTDLYDLVSRGHGAATVFRAYVQKTNTVTYLGRSFDHTIIEEMEKGVTTDPFINLDEVKAIAAKGDSESDDPSKLTRAMKERMAFWGEGLPEEMYVRLDKRYKFWTKDEGELDTAQQALYRQICLAEESVIRDTKLGKSTDKAAATINTLLGSLNRKPVQNTEEDISKFEDIPMGIWIRRFEDERPIPEPDEELKDVDNVVRYIETWFKGHLCKMLGIKNSFSKIYEEEMQKYTVSRPEYDEEEDDEALFYDIFGESSSEEETEVTVSYDFESDDEEADDDE